MIHQFCILEIRKYTNYILMFLCCRLSLTAKNQFCTCKFIKVSTCRIGCGDRIVTIRYFVSNALVRLKCSFYFFRTKLGRILRRFCFVKLNIFNIHLLHKFRDRIFRCFGGNSAYIIH